MRKENRLTVAQLNEVNGGYVFSRIGGVYEIIRDSDGEVLYTYDTNAPLTRIGMLASKWGVSGLFGLLGIDTLLDPGTVAKRMGQSPEEIDWSKLNSLRGLK